MIKIAAVGDVHFGRDSKGKLSKHFQDIETMADILLLAGDLTNLGTVEEAQVLAEELEEYDLPIYACLGNHDFHSDQVEKVTEVLASGGITVLENEGTVININGCHLGIYGAKGFGGGFLGACGSDFGEREMKEFINHTKAIASKIKEGLHAMEADYKVALLHYSPTEETLLGERKEIYPFLGSYLLGEAVDEAKANLVFHGHAHRGTEKGSTPGGIPVRNVAQPVIRHAFNVYSLGLDEFSSAYQASAHG